MNRLRTTGLLLMLALAAAFSASAQKLENYYNRHTQEGGDLFFIYPNEDFKCPQNNSELKFDITYRHGNDSALVNYTYYCKDANPADSIMIDIDGEKIKGVAGKLFMDFEKKLWVHRYSSKLDFDDLERFMLSKQPPQINIITKQGKLDFSVAARKWDKYAAAGEKIVYIIKSE